MTDTTSELRVLHSTYVHCSTLQVEFTMQRLRAWEIWKARGWGLVELKLVVAFLKDAIREKRKWPSSLNFRALIENTDVFEEHLAEAKAWGRIPKMCQAKKDVLRATGRLEPVKARPRSVEEVLRDAKAFEDFKAFARSL